MRKTQTSATRKRFYHQSLINKKPSQKQHQEQCIASSATANPFRKASLLKNDNGVTRPPTAHPYSGYSQAGKKTRDQNSTYSNPMIFSKDQLRQINNQKDMRNQQFQSTNILQAEKGQTRQQTARSIFPYQKSTVDSAKYYYRDTKYSNVRNSNKQNDPMPKQLRLLLNQIKASLKNNSVEENQPYQLLNMLSGRILDLYQHNLSLQQCLNQKDKEIEDLDAQINQLTKKCRNLLMGQQEKKKDRGQSAVKNSKKSDINMELLLQNYKLAEMNKSYLNTINSLSGQKHQNSKTEIVQRAANLTKSNLNCFSVQPTEFGQSEAQLLRCKSRISYLQMKLSNEEQRVYQMGQTNEELHAKIKQMQYEIKQTVQENALSSEKLNEWRERAMMQLEDGEIHLARQQFLLFSIKKLRESNKNLTEKLLMNNGQGARTSVVCTANFQYQVDFFKSIRPMYFDNKSKSYRIQPGRRQETGLLYNEQNNTFEQQYSNYRQHEEIDLQKFSYARPSFFAFIEEVADADISLCRVKGNTSVSRVFIQILRALMYSKLNQFILVDCPQKFTRFPQFVYSWFEKFYFNSEKNTICALQPYMQKPMTQQNFYRDLMNVRLDQSWEIITFRQFLMQELCLQQLYFYLMCQNILLRRAGITKQTQFLGQFSIVVQYSCAKSVIDIVLSDFQSWNISFLATKLRQKVVTRKNIEYIQVGFFMRCLVEYYKIERINRFKYISKLCEEFKSCEKGLRFTSFVSVINRFTEISFDQKIMLYRTCYTVGNGKITPDIIFTVCNQELIFLKYLKLKSFFKLPILTQKPNKALFPQSESANNQSNSIICLQPSHPYIYQIFIQMKKILKDQDNFMKRIQSFGVMDTFTYIFSIQKVFSDKINQIDSSVLKCKHFIHFIYDILSRIRQVNFQNFYQLIDEQGKKKNYLSNSAFWVEIEQSQLGQIFSQQIQAVFKVYKKLRDLINWKQKVYNFRINYAARKIQRQVKKKFIEPYLQLYKIILGQIKKSDGEKQSIQSQVRK